MESLAKAKEFSPSLKLLSVIAYLLSNTFCFAQEEAAKSGYEHWYHVEVIVFKLLQGASSEEIWSKHEVTYPKEMIAIGEAQTKPNFLLQLEQLIEFQATAPKNAEIFETGETTFLFQNASQQYRNRQLLEGEMRDEARKGEISEISEIEEPSNIFDISQFDTIINSQRYKAYSALAGSSLNLAGIAGSLERSSRYKLLMHRAWLQPITNQQTHILIQTGKRYDEMYEIDGTLNLNRNRYLHMNVDLWFTKFIPKYNHQEFLQFKELQIDEDTRNKYPVLISRAKEKDTHEPTQSYRILQSRRMRSDEVHYIDHPLLGLILLVQRFTERTQS